MLKGGLVTASELIPAPQLVSSLDQKPSFNNVVATRPKLKFYLSTNSFLPFTLLFISLLFEPQGSLAVFQPQLFSYQ